MAGRERSLPPRLRRPLHQLCDYTQNAPGRHARRAMALVERHRLAGTGLGWMDVHLLASTLLGHARLWSLDRPLRNAADRLGCGPAP